MSSIPFRIDAFVAKAGATRYNEYRVAFEGTRLHVSIQNVWLISHGRVPKKRFASAGRALFSSPLCPSRCARVRARPRNMWHARGLVISSKLDSSSIQLRVHDLVERILCAALCGISRPSYRFPVSTFVSTVLDIRQVRFPMRPTRRAMLIGRTLIITLISRPSPLHVQGCPNGITNSN